MAKYSTTSQTRRVTGNLEQLEHAPMGDERARRIDDALSSLVEALIPPSPGEDERHADALALARSIIDRYAVYLHLLVVGLY